MSRGSVPGVSDNDLFDELKTYGIGPEDVLIQRLRKRLDGGCQPTEESLKLLLQGVKVLRKQGHRKGNWNSLLFGEGGPNDLVKQVFLQFKVTQMESQARQKEHLDNSAEATVSDEEEDESDHGSEAVREDDTSTSAIHADLGDTSEVVEPTRRRKRAHQNDGALRPSKARRKSAKVLESLRSKDTSCWLDAVLGMVSLCALSRSRPDDIPTSLSSYTKNDLPNIKKNEVIREIVGFAELWSRKSLKGGNCGWVDRLKKKRTQICKILEPILELQPSPGDESRNPVTVFRVLDSALTQLRGGQLHWSVSCKNQNCVGRPASGLQVLLVGDTSMNSFRKILRSHVQDSLLPPEEGSSCPCPQAIEPTLRLEVSKPPSLLFFSTEGLDTSRWISTPQCLRLVRPAEDEFEALDLEYTWLGSICSRGNHWILFWRGSETDKILEYDASTHSCFRTVKCATESLDDKIPFNCKKHIVLTVLGRRDHVRDVVEVLQGPAQPADTSAP